MTLQKAVLKAVELIKKNSGYINNVELWYDESAYFRLSAGEDDYECLFEKIPNDKDILKVICVDLKKWLPLEKILSSGWYVKAMLIKGISVGRKDEKC